MVVVYFLLVKSVVIVKCVSNHRPVFIDLLIAPFYHSP